MSSLIHAALVMLRLLDKLLLCRMSAATGQGLFFSYCHIERNKNTSELTGGAMWVSCEEDKACHHALHDLLTSNLSFLSPSQPQEGDIPSFAPALIQLPYICR